MKNHVLGKRIGKRGRIILAAFLLVAQVSAFADIIPAGRRTAWQGNVGVKGGIPNSSNMTVYITLPAGASLSSINTAIAACPSNQVVQLSAGTYTIAGTITFSDIKGVVLRGAGPKSTILNCSGGAYLHGNIDVMGDGHDTVDPSTVVNWTAGYSDGTTNITLSSTAGLQVGYLIALDELCQGRDFDGTGGIQGCPACSRSNGSRGIVHFAKVMAVNGTTVTIDPPIFGTNWNSNLSPQAWWFGTMSERCGIENMQLNFTNSADNTMGINFMMTYNCWVKNVNSYYGANAHTRFYRSSRGEVRHCYWYATHNAASQSYGFNTYNGNNCLMEDCIAEKIVGTAVLEASSGNVVAYTYTTNVYFTSDAAWMIHCLATHGSHCSYNLFEGNYGTGYSGDYIHGSASHNTVFRNVLTGWEPGKTGDTTPIQLQATNHYANVVGNILGTAGYHTGYEGTMIPAYIHDVMCYNSGGSYTPLDGVVTNTLLRHGNYNVVNKAIVWDPSITNHTLLSSYYLASKPSYWGANQPWPPYDPANPAAASMTNIPAGYRFVFGVDPQSGGLDTNAPTISNVSPSSLTTNSVTITWTTDEPATSIVDDGATAAYGTSVTNGSLVVLHSLTIASLSSDSTNHFRVRSADGSGNLATSPDGTFVTLPAPPTGLRVISP